METCSPMFLSEAARVVTKTAGNRNQQRRNRRDQTVSDRQDGESRQCRGDIHAVLEDADEQAANDIDQRDQYRRHRVALREPNGSVHRAVEFGFPTTSRRRSRAC